MNTELFKEQNKTTAPKLVLAESVWDRSSARVQHLPSWNMSWWTLVEWISINTVLEKMERLKHHILGWRKAEYFHQHGDNRKSTQQKAQKQLGNKFRLTQNLSTTPLPAN